MSQRNGPLAHPWHHRLYHGDDPNPEPPFVDEYAKFEELKAEWLSRMWNVFNGKFQ
jgi:hypothetical protein